MIIIVTFATLFFVFGIPYLISSTVDPKGTSEVIDAIFKKKKYDVKDEMNFFNDAEWVKKVILSCKSNKQVWNAYRLSENLRNKYRNKVNNDTLWLVSNEISKVFDNHHDKLITNEARRFNLPCN
jgi:hypothetical protein